MDMDEKIRVHLNQRSFMSAGEVAVQLLRFFRRATLSAISFL